MPAKTVIFRTHEGLACGLWR